MTGENCKAQNLVGGVWSGVEEYQDLIDPMTGDVMGKIPLTSKEESKPFIDSLNSVPKHGLHNPFKAPERYLMYGDVSRRAAEVMNEQDVQNFFTKLVQRVAPKSDTQARGEVVVTAKFLANFAGDNVRYLARGFQVPGDHQGQVSQGFRWPFGPVSVIAPFNFPIEIPVLQMMGALYMGNKPLVKVDNKVSICIEQFIRLLHHCGMPKEDLDLIHCDGPEMESILKKSDVRLTQFTGSSRVGERLAKALHGKVRLEDAGFDWKILGPDVDEVDYVAWQCDQDAYAFSGQKCSAQSIMFMHTNWHKHDFLPKLKEQASKRSLLDMSIGPVLTWNNTQIKEHID